MNLEIEDSEELAAARKAVEELRAKRIRHIGRFPGRMDLPCEQATRERALSEGWMRENVSRFSGPTLETLLESDPKLSAPIRVTPEIARAVATVIQWLGTNVGFSCLCEWLKVAGYSVRKIAALPNSTVEAHTAANMAIEIAREALLGNDPS